jgi:Flp pilus assembly protein CpaB
MQSIQAVQKFVSTKFLATRRGTIVLGIAAAGLAAIVLLIYLNQYRDSVGTADTPVPVLVARKVIEIGTPGEVVQAQGGYEFAQTAEEYVKIGAISDPNALDNTVAITQVAPGQQLTTADFQAVASSGVGAQLEKGQRAVAIPIDTHRGLIGRLMAGDKVDIYADLVRPNGEAVVKLMLQDIYVLEAPGATSSGVSGNSNESNVLVRVDSQQAAKLAWVTEHGKAWFVLRPRLGAKKVPARSVGRASVLASGR